MLIDQSFKHKRCSALKLCLQIYALFNFCLIKSSMDHKGNVGCFIILYLNNYWFFCTFAFFVFCLIICKMTHQDHNTSTYFFKKNIFSNTFMNIKIAQDQKCVLKFMWVHWSSFASLYAVLTTGPGYIILIPITHGLWTQAWTQKLLTIQKFILKKCSIFVLCLIIYSSRYESSW